MLKRRTVRPMKIKMILSESMFSGYKGGRYWKFYVGFNIISLVPLNRKKAIFSLQTYITFLFGKTNDQLVSVPIDEIYFLLRRVIWRQVEHLEYAWFLPWFVRRFFHSFVVFNVELYMNAFSAAIMVTGPRCLVLWPGGYERGRGSLVWFREISII